MARKHEGRYCWSMVEIWHAAESYCQHHKRIIFNATIWLYMYTLTMFKVLIDATPTKGYRGLVLALAHRRHVGGRPSRMNGPLAMGPVRPSAKKRRIPVRPPVPVHTTAGAGKPWTFLSGTCSARPKGGLRPLGARNRT